MKAKTKTMLTFFSLVLLIVVLYSFSGWFSKTVGYVVGEDEKVKLVQCLDAKGAVFYISDVCPDCDEQTEIFGKSALSYIDNIINCDRSDSKTCESLKGVPAWGIGGRFYYGILSIEELGKVSGCDNEMVK